MTLLIFTKMLNYLEFQLIIELFGSYEAFRPLKGTLFSLFSGWNGHQRFSYHSCISTVTVFLWELNCNFFVENRDEMRLGLVNKIFSIGQPNVGQPLCINSKKGLRSVFGIVNKHANNQWLISIAGLRNI